MRQVSTFLNACGLAWLFVDNPATVGEINLDEKKNGRIRPYVIPLSPLAVRDWAYGSDGLLEWAIIAETKTEKSDPFKEPEDKEYRRLWTRKDWMLFVKNSNGEIKLEAEGNHNLACVPLIKIEEIDGYGLDSNHWFEDIVRVSDSILNGESECQMNIIKQMFGLLVLPESFRSRAMTQIEEEDENGDIEKRFANIIARSCAISETAEEKNISRYITPP